MKKLFYPITFLGLWGCASGELLPPQTKDVTSISLHNSLTKETIVEIHDGEKVGEIVNFINGLKNDWQEPSFGEPDDVFELKLYKGKLFAGNFAVGEDYFSRDHQLTWVQEAEANEIKAFADLLNLDLRSMQIYTACDDYVADQITIISENNKFAANEINLMDKRLLLSNYPNWCQTELNGQTYRVYSNDSNEFVVELYMGVSRFSGPFDSEY